MPWIDFFTKNKHLISAILACCLFSFFSTPIIYFYHNQALIRTALKANAIRHGEMCIQHTLELLLNERLSSLSRMAERWSIANRTPKELWLHDTANYIKNLPEIKNIAWVDSTGQLQWMTPTENQSDMVDFVKKTIASNSFMLSQRAKQTIIPPTKLTNGEFVFLSFSRVTSKDHFDGYILAAFDVRIFFKEALTFYQDTNYEIAISYNGIRFYESSFFAPSQSPTDVTHFNLNLLGKIWDLSIYPNKSQMAQNEGILEIILIATSLIFALLVGYFVLNLINSRLRTLSINKTNKLLQTVLESTYHMVIATDLKGVVTLFNKAAERELGYTAEEIVGKATPEIWHDFNEVMNKSTLLSKELGTSIKPGFDVFVAKARRGVISTDEWTLIRKDGSRFPVTLTPTTLSDGRAIVGYLGVLENISIKKKTSHEIKELRRAMECTIEGIAILDTQGCYFFVNEAYATITGYKAEELVGKQSNITVHPEDRPYLFSEYQKMLTSGYVAPEVRGIKKDGTMFYKQLSMISHFDENGAFIGHYCFMKDISERKEREQQLELLTDKLVQSNTELERFAYIASHDLQEPIRMITNFSEIIMSDYGSNFDKEGKEYLEIIISAGVRMKEIIEDLLAYSRVSNTDERRTLFDANKLLQSTIDNMVTLLEERHVALTSEHLPTLYGNPVQILRVLQNLLINAIKYQSPERKPEIHIRAEETKDFWWIVIEDNGIGIKPEFIQVIFQPFKRLHTWNQISGTGLGLAICKKIIENHGGTIKVTSKYGAGSVFSFSLPKHDAKEKA